MTYSDAIIKRLTDLCLEREITINKLATLSECIFQEELHMIVTSFRKTAEVVYAIDGENKFINCILDLKRKHKYLLVYSMAQNLNGDGRRSLIPLLCDYYNLINMYKEIRQILIKTIK